MWCIDGYCDREDCEGCHPENFQGGINIENLGEGEYEPPDFDDDFEDSQEDIPEADGEDEEDDANDPD